MGEKGVTTFTPMSVPLYYDNKYVCIYERESVCFTTDACLQVLKVYPFPATVTAFQFGCGTVLVLLMWGLNLYPRPNVTRSQVSQ